MPQDPEIVGPHPENSLMQIVCQRIGLAPSEWKALSSLERLPWLRDALDSAAAAEPEKGQATKSEKGDSGIPSEIEDELRKLTCIQPLPLRLLNEMWELRSASQGDLVPYVWGDQPTQSALKSAVYRANNAIFKIQHKRVLTLSG